MDHVGWDHHAPGRSFPGQSDCIDATMVRVSCLQSAVHDFLWRGQVLRIPDASTGNKRVSESARATQVTWGRFKAVEKRPFCAHCVGASLALSWTCPASHVPVRDCRKEEVTHPAAATTSITVGGSRLKKWILLNCIRLCINRYRQNRRNLKCLLPPICGFRTS